MRLHLKDVAFLWFSRVASGELNGHLKGVGMLAFLPDSCLVFTCWLKSLRKFAELRAGISKSDRSYFVFGSCCGS